jgi:hypothetical protein
VSTTSDGFFQKSSNPTFLRSFLVSDRIGVGDDTQLRISAYDFRDRFTATRTLLGSACITVADLKEQGAGSQFFKVPLADTLRQAKGLFTRTVVFMSLRVARQALHR